MDRDEILARAQKEQRDERQDRIRDRSILWTYGAMVLAAAVFAFARSRQGQPISDLAATVCTSVAVGQLYRFFRLRDKFHLILGLVALAVAIFAAVRFFMGY